MAVQLFSHNMQAYGAVKTLLEKTSKAAVIHPTGTGKSFIAFKWVEENPEMRFLWLSPSDSIYQTQAENVQRIVPDFLLEGIRFFSYARLIKLLFSIDMLNEGVHVRGVSGVIWFRSTISPIMDKQQIGQALTAGTQSTPLILDVKNNFEGLSSYGTLLTEMDEAIARLRREYRDDEVLVEQFTVHEEMKDAVSLFRQLEASLSNTLDTYYDAACAYCREHGHLRVPVRYEDANGLCLGRWIDRQRSDGQLTQGQDEARCFHKDNGHLDVPGNYESEIGFAPGRWISAQRQAKSGAYGRKALTEEQIAALDALGMLWETRKERQRRLFFEAAKAYYRQNGSLRVPRRYETPEGLSWVAGHSTSVAHGSRASARIGSCMGNRRLWGCLEAGSLLPMKGNSLLGFA